MADEEPDAYASGSNERACLRRRRANRLLDEDVPSGGQRASCEPRVRLDRAGDYYDVSARYGFFVAPEPVDSVGRSRIEAWIVASGDLVAALESAKYPGMHSAHGTQAHQRDLVSSTRSFHASVRPGRWHVSGGVYEHKEVREIPSFAPRGRARTRSGGRRRARDDGQKGVRDALASGVEVRDVRERRPPRAGTRIEALPRPVQHPFRARPGPRHL